MCGITGIYSENKLATVNRVEAMNNALMHRGPDDAGIIEFPTVVLGHRRLSIIDLSSAGHQPMQSADKRYSIVYNGEIYNYREIRSEIGESDFQTNTDTEVILAAWSRWGEDALHRLIGMFAFALYDAVLEQLFLVRDRLGIKPLYYWQDQQTVVFASEIRALLASNLIPRKIDKAGLGEYIRYQTVHAPNTLVEGIKMLLPGHFIQLSKTSIEKKCWWKLPGEFRTENATSTLPEIHRTVRSLLRNAVERRLIADVPFGAFLSGGIDSSAIVGLMSEVSSSPVKTFSVTFDESAFSEARYADLIAKRFATEHHEIRLKPRDFLQDLPHALAAMDHPCGDGSNTYVVSKATRAAGITMALSGLGGDELFGGYPIFSRAHTLRKWKWIGSLPFVLRSSIANAVEKIRPGIASSKLADALRLPVIDFEHVYPLARLLLTTPQVESLEKDMLDHYQTVQQIVNNPPNELTGQNFLTSRVSIAEITGYMQNILLRDTDQMSMTHALEVRVPFLDYTLVEYVLSLPDHFKSLHSPKKLLVDSLGDLLPEAIVNRPKMGFTLPWDNWMRTELHEFCSKRMNQLSRRGIFDEKGILNSWQQFEKQNPSYTWSRIWPLIVLEDWLERNNMEL
jgi:asparagine synthase (glutamine-hydrolysing)